MTGSAHGILSTMADRAVRIFPFLADVRVVRCWAALRVMSKDGFPIYDQSETAPGAFLATCHSGVDAFSGPCAFPTQDDRRRPALRSDGRFQWKEVRCSAGCVKRPIRAAAMSP